MLEPGTLSHHVIYLVPKKVSWLLVLVTFNTCVDIDLISDLVRRTLTCWLLNNVVSNLINSILVEVSLTVHIIPTARSSSSAEKFNIQIIQLISSCSLPSHLLTPRLIGQYQVIGGHS